MSHSSSTIVKQKKKVKQLCDWSKKDFREHFDELCEIVDEPCYVCIKCGRAAGSKEWLCKAKSL